MEAVNGRKVGRQKGWKAGRLEGRKTQKDKTEEAFEYMSMGSQDDTQRLGAGRNGRRVVR